MKLMISIHFSGILSSPLDLMRNFVLLSRSGLASPITQLNVDSFSQPLKGVRHETPSRSAWEKKDAGKTAWD
jgi:hypothetical protein